MGINFKILVAAIFVLAIASCASEGEQQSSNPIPPPNTPAKTQKPPAQSFNNPVVPPQATSLTSASASLIQPTNAKARINIVSKGRNDPFAQIVGQSPLGVADSTMGMRPVPRLLPLPITNTRGKLIATRTPQKSSVVLNAKLNKSKNNINKAVSSKNLPKLTPVLPKVIPPVVPDQRLASVLPPPPQPDLAKAVFVSGVVMLGNQLQAIIKVPNEPTSRYVQAGQRLANGVLIKRIEMNEGSEPIIILEQYGIEVSKMVGEAPATSPTTATTATTGGLPT
ncbi:hypothetical protein B4U84_16660 [Westiellopsis prolifica IICB1]|nr:hypothetical protein B4U84_16660 [Westiellopsis prolifica IICB1]